MANIIDLTGQRFGKLTALERVEIETKNGKKKQKWLCKCECGNTTTVITNHLTSGHIKSCGCYAKEKIKKRMTTHGLSKTRLYKVFYKMKERCYNPNNNRYYLYGERGITICDEWKDDFMKFYKWAMSNGYDETAPKGQCTIDRIDVNGNYEPNNCKWVTTKEQNNNTRTNILITYKNETHTLSEWAEILNIKTSTLYFRLRIQKWSVEEAFTKKVRKKNR